MSTIEIDGLVKVSKAVTPANAGVQKWLISLDSRIRGNDENGEISTFYEFIKIMNPKTIFKCGSCFVLFPNLEPLNL